MSSALLKRDVGSRARTIALSALALGAIVLLALGTGFLAGGGESSPGATTISTATTEISRRDLVEVENEDGTLRYADERAVVNRLGGTVTALPKEGRVIEPGEILYRVDGEPVTLLSGRTPAYRRLSSAVPAGTDVEQLERNLRALGYDDGEAMELDEDWDAATTAAVIRWQQAGGLDQTGSIELGQVVFQPGPRRIASVRATLGAPAAGPVLATTSTRSQVTVALDTAKQSLARGGAAVTVELPSGEDVRGRIISVGKVATKVQAQGGGSTGEATIPVTIALSGKTSTLDQAPATVHFERGKRKDVLAIPVTALLARAGGKFAVEVRGEGEPRVVGVTAGLYTSGYVEIRGPGLNAGMKVTDARV